MRLKKLKLAGFKSFVDPTSVIFPSNLVAVVGPNGCGKSNIIDAVRWVMGESSAKYLRGESMTDVIFNGSSQRNPVGQAVVEMIFDNSAGMLSGAYASYSEIALRRVVTRDSQSSYYLNGARCRRRDIADILMGTGLGPRSYSIIGQGTISRLIEARPEELRTYLEEAAGIAKYKERRRETEMRISHARDNLARLDDLRGELADQLNKLQRQVATAVAYTELHTQERLLKAQGFALRWHSTHQLLEQQQLKITQVEASVALEQTALLQLNSKLEHLNNSQQQASESFNQSQSTFYAIGAEIARLEEALQHQQRRRQQLEHDKLHTEHDLQIAQQHQTADQAEIAQLQHDITVLQPELAKITQQGEILHHHLTTAELAQQQWQQQWDDFNQHTAESSQIAQVAQTKIHHFEQNINIELLRIEKLQQEQAVLDEQAIVSKVTALQQQYHELNQQHVELTTAINALVCKLTAQRDSNQQLSRDSDKHTQQLQHLQGKLTTLEALQHVALGKNNAAITGWLQQQQLPDISRLAQELIVADGWEKAVETVLGDYLQAVCLTNFDTLALTLPEFQGGNMMLLDAAVSNAVTNTVTKVAVTDSAVMLLHKVSCNFFQLQQFLHGIYIATDLQQARNCLAQLRDHETVITQDGLWLGKGWMRIARDNDPTAGILQRSQLIKKLQQQCVVSAVELAELRQRYESGVQQLQQDEQQRDKLSQQINIAHQLATECSARLRVVQHNLTQSQQRAAVITDDILERQLLLEDMRHQLYNTQQAWQHATQVLEQSVVQREQLVVEREQLKQQLEQLRYTAQQQRNMSQELKVDLNTAQSKLATAQQNSSRMSERIDGLLERQHSLATAIMHAAQPDEDTAIHLQHKSVAYARAEDELAQCRQQVALIMQELRQVQAQRLTVEDTVRTLHSKLDQLRLDRQTFSVKCTTLEEAIAETVFTLPQLLLSLQELTAVNDIKVEAKALDAKLQIVCVKIRQLGAVNLAAIEEYETASQRKQYLDAQHHDLTQALEILDNAIAKIDRETRQRFKDTYDKVSHSFQELFPRLFGGGQAYLELTGADLLNAGVTVMARPPGKRNSSIYLLSGGEKAMTAVALVFAIFQLTPSPFCMLDEVDAPLDDSNVSRFCAMVKEMSSQVQFIFVTHNKVAMELATHLAGVTMHEPGVSRIVAVDIDEAVSLAET